MAGSMRGWAASLGATARRSESAPNAARVGDGAFNGAAIGTARSRRAATAPASGRVAGVAAVIPTNIKIVSAQAVTAAHGGPARVLRGSPLVTAPRAWALTTPQRGRRAALPQRADAPLSIYEAHPVPGVAARQQSADASRHRIRARGLRERMGHAHRADAITEHPFYGSWDTRLPATLRRRHVTARPRASCTWSTCCINAASA